MTLLVSRRVPMDTSPKGGFLYALVTDETQSIQIGVGHESPTGLNMTHVMTMNLKPGFAYEIADQIEREGIRLKTGRLAPMFNGLEAFDLSGEGPGMAYYLEGTDAEGRPTRELIKPAPMKRTLLAEAIRMAHDAVWGHPEDWKVDEVSLGDGRLIWLAYDSAIDKIRLGIGYYDDTNTAILGDQSFSVNKRMAGDFVVDAYTKPGVMFFYALPPRWPLSMVRHIGHENKQKVAKAFLKMADRVWRGEVKTTGRRLLTDAEIAAANGQK
ncbi:hypothetical protein HOT99_gp297 [Caulobacter phage CcrBL10]|uniref:Uncharacterized protein n=1 Tax=Caulobacter phage CcrBL10 TaxID=2283269 RepID=A0A385E9H6_9CAUD|nr:hypothetical protein HOT99_gp297 [Caulobacter phage CcrBL10]AXQ68320.1 hypothetical protein CcrBL10_gp116c [Caulobacter phage CcrBL10]